MNKKKQVFAGKNREKKIARKKLEKMKKSY